jgi:hypothetical protein
MRKRRSNSNNPRGSRGTRSREHSVSGELILYTTQDGQSRIQLRAQGGTVWVTQAEIAELFQTTPQNITLHIKAIYAERELLAEATCKEHLQVREEGKRQVKRALKHYNLDVVLAVGYRVRSHRGTQFRQWATTNLRQYLVKGFVIDDERLKDPSGRDYFDELLERIREIRASEKRFYQKIREIYATAVDYDAKGELAKLFFKKVQNKMLWAISGHTAAELISSRTWRVISSLKAAFNHAYKQKHVIRPTPGLI